MHRVSSIKIITKIIQTKSQKSSKHNHKNRFPYLPIVDLAAPTIMAASGGEEAAAFALAGTATAFPLAGSSGGEPDATARG